MSEKSLKEIEKMVADLRSKFGESSVMRFTDRATKKVPVIPTGSLMLDRATGVGGYPRGRIIEVFGPESSGKTTLTLHAIAEAQRAGGIAAFIDAEHALDISYASKLGVVINEMILSQPDNGEQALDIVEDMAGSGKFAIIVIDSVAALVPKVELEGDMGQPHMGVQARLMSQALRKLTGVTHRSGTTIFFINQIRHKIGVMFGSPETTTGGNALKFYASMRMDVRRREQRKDGEDQATGNLTVVKVVKNKLAPPFREAQFDILYGVGIDKVGDLINAAVESGVLVKSGAWYAHKGKNIAQGFNALSKKLEDKALFNEIYAGVLAIEGL